MIAMLIPNAFFMLQRHAVGARLKKTMVARCYAITGYAITGNAKPNFVMDMLRSNALVATQASLHGATHIYVTQNVM